mmetsp:Transcript_48662/g.148030  ORF Transcript_48662/g.148030 Transcript_48662/m.148030 type:complete len:235 (-) Transcript_48662:75-779(-)
MGLRARILVFRCRLQHERPLDVALLFVAADALDYPQPRGPHRRAAVQQVLRDIVGVVVERLAVVVGDRPGRPRARTAIGQARCQQVVLAHRHFLHIRCGELLVRLGELPRGGGGPIAEQGVREAHSVRHRVWVQSCLLGIRVLLQSGHVRRGHAAEFAHSLQAHSGGRVDRMHVFGFFLPASGVPIAGERGGCHGLGAGRIRYRVTAPPVGRVRAPEFDAAVAELREAAAVPIN